MQIKIRTLKGILITLQITILLCGVSLWYGNSGIYVDSHTESIDWVAQDQVITENSVKRSGTMNTPVSSLSGEEPSSSATGKELIIEMSAYTSRVEETDSSPCISADGTNICEYDGCVVASNDYEFGTKVVIDGFGECEVKDRMNSRYNGTGNMDIYFKMDLKGALEFGRKHVKVAITS